MIGRRHHKGNVQVSARSTVANVSEYGRAFEGGAGRDIRMEGFVGYRPGTGITPDPGGSVSKFKVPILILLAVVLLAS